MLERHDKVEVMADLTSSLPSKFGKWIATFIAIATPVCYLNGRAFHDGYLEQLHVAPSMFPANVQDIFICAARAWLEGSSFVLGTIGQAIRAHWFLVLVLPITLITALSATAHYVVYHIAKSQASTKKQFALPKILQSVLTPVLTMFLSAYTIYTCIALIGAALILSIVPFAQVGAKVAVQDIARGFPNSPTQEVSVPHAQPTTYRVVECSDKFCYLYKPGQIITVPISSITWAMSEIGDTGNSKEVTNTGTP